MGTGIAVIGLGTVGRRMLSQVAMREDLFISAAWSRNAATAERAAREVPGTPIVKSAEEAIADPRTRIVYVGTTPGVHRLYAELVSRHGRVLFCEKPLTESVAESRALVTSLQAAGTPHGVNFVFASAPGVRNMQRMLGRGELGRLRGGEIRLFFTRWPRDWQADAQWLRFRAEGGFTREVLSHFVFLLRRLFGSCTLRGGSVVWPGDPALCETGLSAAFDCGGLPVVVQAASGGAGPDIVEFVLRGEERSLRLSNWYELAVSDGGEWRPVADETGPHAGKEPRTATYQSQLDSLAAMAAGKKHPLPDAAEALAVQETIETLLAHA
jgi:predicted dehydrogenase